MPKSKDEIYAEITEAFISTIKNDGTVPWRKGWTCDGILPSNFQSKRPYRGMNSMWLGLMQQAKGYSTPYWSTFNGARKSGGSVRKGEKGSMAILWKFLAVEDKKNPGQMKRVPMLKTFTVFNLDQIDGIEYVRPTVGQEREPSGFHDWLRGQYAEPPAFQQIECPQAYYSPMSDLVVVPASWQFESEMAEAETIGHEYVHSTGHPSRLSRFELGWTERQDYAKEELVAEIGAAMLMQNYGIDPNVPMMAAYVQSWLTALENDHSLIVGAAQQAQKACDRISGYVYVEEQEATEKEQAA
jgi:antirestriction protein ArdC